MVVQIPEQYLHGDLNSGHLNSEQYGVSYLNGTVLQISVIWIPGVLSFLVFRRVVLLREKASTFWAPFFAIKVKT